MYMANYCGQLADARTDEEKFENLARIFYPEHLSAMFRIFDKTQRRALTLVQYKMGKARRRN
jgi:hypothetical protein